MLVVNNKHLLSGTPSPSYRPTSSVPLNVARGILLPTLLFVSFISFFTLLTPYKLVLHLRAETMPQTAPNHSSCGYCSGILFRYSTSVSALD